VLLLLLVLLLCVYDETPTVEHYITIVLSESQANVKFSRTMRKQSKFADRKIIILNIILKHLTFFIVFFSIVELQQKDGC